MPLTYHPSTKEHADSAQRARDGDFHLICVNHDDHLPLVWKTAEWIDHYCCSFNYRSFNAFIFRSPARNQSRPTQTDTQRIRVSFLAHYSRKKSIVTVSYQQRPISRCAVHPLWSGAVLLCSHPCAARVTLPPKFLIAAAVSPLSFGTRTEVQGDQGMKKGHLSGVTQIQQSTGY